MVNTPWIFRCWEAIWRHGLQCDYPSYDGPRLTSWSRNFKEFGVENRDGVGVPMKKDEGMKKIMGFSHRQNYPPRRFQIHVRPTANLPQFRTHPKRQKFFVSPKLP